MTDKPSYEELEQQLAEAKKQLKKKSKNKESYAQKHLKLWEKFFLGNAKITDFARESRTKKTESMHQYFFIRNGEACFQYKTFILDMIEAYCLVKGLPKQRESMMRYELKKALSGKSEKPGQSDKVKTKKKTETQPAEKKVSAPAQPKTEAQSVISGFVETAKPQPQKPKAKSSNTYANLSPAELAAGIEARKKAEAEMMAKVDARLEAMDEPKKQD